MEFFCFYLFCFLNKQKPNPMAMPIQHVQYQCQSIKHKKAKMDNFLWMENEQNIFNELFLHFFHFIGSHVVVLVVQISVLSNKSYGCEDGIHVKEIVKNSLSVFRFQAILYLSFIFYHPVVQMLFI